MRRFDRFVLAPLVLIVALSLGSARGLAVFAAPTIDYPPSPQSTTLGGTARFTVIASGTPPLTYQWRKNGVDLTNGGTVAGATTDVLTLTAVTSTDAAGYSVVVSNGTGDAASVDATLSVTTPQAGDVDFSFDPPEASMNKIVRAVALQPDGKVLIGGDFSSVNGAVRNFVARLNADGSTDHTFGNGLSGVSGSRVYCLAVQQDGRVLLGGTFTAVDGVGRNNVARLNPDGSLDTTFLDGLAGTDGTVYAVAVQADGRILLGGAFTAVNGDSRYRIARLNADGSLDATFLEGLEGANGSIVSIALQPDARVLIGGDFTTFNGASRGRVARLNVDGALDTTFLNGFAGAGATVYSLAVQPDSRVVIAGAFSFVNGVIRHGIARLNDDGSLDTGFLNGVSGASLVRSVALQADGRVLIGGDFTTVNGVTRNRIARLDAGGNLDPTFLQGLAGTSGTVYSVAVQVDGRPLIAGDFTTVNGSERNRIARLIADGSLDTTFPGGPVGINGDIRDLALQPDGRMLIVGTFTAIGEVSRNRIARLNADGSLDTTFLDGLEGADGTVAMVAVQPDGRVLIGGEFATVNGVQRGRVARLNADGSLDNSFLSGLAGADATVQSLDVQPDGRVLIGGLFATVNGSNRVHIARLNVDGSVDGTFNSPLPYLNSAVWCIAVQPDGRVLIGGQFTATVDGVGRPYIARLDADGSPDNTFYGGLNGGPSSFAVLPDGRFYVGGSFTTVYGGVSRKNIVRLNANGMVDPTFLNSALAGPDSAVFDIVVQPDGRVLISGFFTTVNGVTRRRVVRMNADGSLDTTFLNGLAGADAGVSRLALQPDGRALIAGSFGGVNNVPRKSIARVYGSAPVAPTINLEPSGVASYEGCCASFHVSATGTPLDYQWRKDGMDLADGPGVSGAHTATLTIYGVTSADEGDYSVVVSNVLGSQTSLEVPLSVSAVPACKAATCDALLGCVLVDAVVAPSEASGVTVSKAGTDATIAWTLAAGATTSDILRGDLASLPVGPGGDDEVCLGSTAATTMTDSDVPPAGSGVWYLVRGANTCAGSGSYGVEGVQGLPGAPRVSSTCP